MLKYYFVINVLFQLHNRGKISFNENNNQNITCVNAQLNLKFNVFAHTWWYSRAELTIVLQMYQDSEMIEGLPEEDVPYLIKVCLGYFEKKYIIGFQQLMQLMTQQFNSILSQSSDYFSNSGPFITQQKCFVLFWFTQTPCRYMYSISNSTGCLCWLPFITKTPNAI